MPMSATAIEEFVVVGVQADAIQVKSSDGEILDLSPFQLTDVFDSVVRLTFRASSSLTPGHYSVPIVLNAVVSRDADGKRDRVEVFQIKPAGA